MGNIITATAFANLKAKLNNKYFYCLIFTIYDYFIISVLLYK